MAPERRVDKYQVSHCLYLVLVWPRGVCATEDGGHYGQADTGTGENYGKPYQAVPYKSTMSSFEVVEDEYSDKKRPEKDPNDFWSSYVTIYGIENEHLPSMFVLESGKFPKVKNEVLVDSKFANFKVYKSGQQKEVKVKISGIMNNTGEGSGDLV